MPRSFDLSADYQGTVEQVYSAFADRQYWADRLADSGADEATLDSMAVGDDGSITVATTQVLRAAVLPALVTQLHRGDLQIKRQENWAPVADGRATATIEASMPGAPVSVTGSAALRPAGAGSRMDVDLRVEVRIPLVGGKVEGFIGSQLVELLVSEQRFTTAWIAEHRGP